MRARIHPFEKEKEHYFLEGCHINELSNSAEDSDVSIARARVEPGRATRWHCLSGIVERYVMLQGRGLVEVGDDLVQKVLPRFVPGAYEDLES